MVQFNIHIGISVQGVDLAIKDAYGRMLHYWLYLSGVSDWFLEKVGLEPTFCFRLMYKQNKQLLTLIEPVVKAMGYELLGIEHLKQGRYSLLRLYIDNEQGISLSDCERVSHQVTGVLDIEDPIKGTYNLEVSSPGLDRPLFTLAQFGRHQGEDVKLNLATKIEGRRKIQGRIADVGEEHVLIESEGNEYRVPADAIQQAHIVSKMIDLAVLNK